MVLSNLQVNVFREDLETFSSPDIDIAFGHVNSVDQEIDKNVAGDIKLFAITILLMMTFACFATLTSE